LVVVVAVVVTLSAREMARPTLLGETVVAAFCVVVVSVLVILLPGTFMEATFLLLPLFLGDPFSENDVIRPEVRVFYLILIINVYVDFSCSTVAPIIDINKRGCHLVVLHMVVNVLFCSVYIDVSDEIRGDVLASGGREPCR